MWTTEAKQLITDKQGHIAGIAASSPGEPDVRIGPRCVILPICGFAGYPDIIQRLDASYREKEILYGGLPLKGDGTRMASELGAVIYGFALDLEGQVVLA